MKNKRFKGVFMCGLVLSQMATPLATTVFADEVSPAGTETTATLGAETRALTGYAKIPTSVALAKNSAVSKIFKTSKASYGLQIQALRTSEEAAENTIGNNIYNLGYGAYTVKQTASYDAKGAYTEVNGDPMEVRLNGAQASTVNLDATGDGEYTLVNSTRVPGFKKDDNVYKYQFPHAVEGNVTDNQNLFVSPKLVMAKGNISFTKTDGKGKPLAGAKFELHRVVDVVAGTTNKDVKVKGVATSDSKGKVTFSGLTEGLYYAQEISTADGYVKDTDKIFFEVFALDGGTYANSVESYNKGKFSPKLYSPSEKAAYEKTVKSVYGDYVAGKTYNKSMGITEQDYDTYNKRNENYPAAKKLSDIFLEKLKVEKQPLADLEVEVANKVFVREVTTKVNTDKGGKKADEIMFAEKFYNYKKADIQDDHTLADKAGDDLKYTADVNIPYNIDEYKSYVITDTTTRKELALDVTSIKIGNKTISKDQISTYGTVAKNSKNGGFTFTTSDAQRKAIRAELDRQGYAEKTDRETGAVLHFNIDAEDLYDLDDITNTIKVDWATASDSGSDTDTETTHTKSAGITIHKVNGKNKEEHLAGAEFKLYLLGTDVDSVAVAYPKFGEEYGVVSEGELDALHNIGGKEYVGGVMGRVKKGGVDEGYIVKSLKTGEDGIIEIDHLRPGHYALVETKAPAGYRLNSTPIEIDLTKGFDTDLTNSDQTLNVYNYSQNGYMPATGTTGIMISLAVVGAAGLGVTVTRKKSKELEDENL